MTQLAFNLPEPERLAVERAPFDAPVIDRAHLDSVTYGDRSLRRELLELFDRQATILVARMRNCDATALAALAHTLKGSAAGIGATWVAQAAAAAESAANAPLPERAAAVDRLAAVVDRVRPEIAALLMG